MSLQTAQSVLDQLYASPVAFKSWLARQPLHDPLYHPIQVLDSFLSSCGPLEYREGNSTINREETTITCEVPGSGQTRHGALFPKYASIRTSHPQWLVDFIDILVGDKFTYQLACAVIDEIKEDANKTS